MKRSPTTETLLRAIAGMLLCAALESGHAAAEGAACAAPPPAHRFLRFDEDFTAMRDAACRAGAWDALKHVALDDAGIGHASLGGDARWQLVNARYLSFGNEGGDNHNVFLRRYHLHASVRAAADLRVFAELKANRQSGREPGPLVVDVDRIDVHQAFVDIGSDRSLRMRIGRQELLYGSGRRIFPRNGPNVRGNYDAVRVALRHGGWQTDALLFRPVAIDPGPFDDDSLDTQTFWGAYASGPWPGAAPLALDLYAIAAKRIGARFPQGVADERRQSFGARLSGRVDAWDHDHELTLQRGRFGAGSIRAWSVAGEFGHQWSALDHRPRAALRFTVGSGDRDPGDADLQTFFSLFPRGGAVDDGFGVSAANITNLRATLARQFGAQTRAVVGLSGQWRTSRRDGVYGAGGGLLRGAGASTARHVGTGVDVLVIWTFGRHVVFDVNAGYFRSGRFIAESGPDRNMAFITPTLQLRF